MPMNPHEQGMPDGSALHFTKMHGAGNDFIALDGRYGLPFDPAEFAQVACDRHFGIGADGLIILETSQNADFGMSYFNADGSRAICGNGMRCMSRFIYKLHLLQPDQRRFLLETDKGTVEVEMFGPGERFRVDLGAPAFDGDHVPTSKPGEHIAIPLEAAGVNYTVTAVGMGNPHCVIFVPDIKPLDLERIGPPLEHHPFFPKRTNVEFVEIVDRVEARMRVWERGCGETLACGTGVCAVLAAAVREGRMERQIRVVTRGGEFEVLWNEANDRIYLTGPAEDVFTGKINALLLLKNRLGGGLYV